MRTDSTKYSKEFVDKTKKYINTEYGTDYISKNIGRLVNSGSNEKKTKKKKDNNAQEAHEAIRPTKIDVNTLSVSGKITAREVKLYNLIWRNTVESCMSPAKYYSITSKISAPEEHFYKYSSEQVIFPGWKIVDGYEKENNEYKLCDDKNNSEDPTCSNSCSPTHCTSTADHMNYMNITMGTIGDC